MLIYGAKKINLKTIDIPIACINCGHTHQRLQIYRKFLSVYFIPLIPLRKKVLVNCPGCFRELKKKTFFQELASKGFDSVKVNSHFKSLLKAAKTPLYMYILPFLFLALVAGVFTYGFHESQRNQELIKEYLQFPVGNAIILIKSQSEAYPYRIGYIPEIRDQKAVVFDWRYSYESKNDANKAVELAYKSIDKNSLGVDFDEPYIATVEDIKSTDIISIRLLNKTIDWEQFIPSEDPSEETIGFEGVE